MDLPRQQAQNLVITGPTGAGKSWLAQRLGHQACREDLRVQFIRQPSLVLAMLTAKAAGAFLKRLTKFDILIIDDLGVSLMKMKCEEIYSKSLKIALV